MAFFINIIRLLRPAQWVKNVFVLLPVFFSGSMTDAPKVVDALWVFLCFCLISSSVYCINDARDCNADRLHPTKRRRPIAAGEITPRLGYIIGASLAVIVAPICLLSGVYDPFLTLSIIYAYLLLNVAYCMVLKRFVVIDVVALSVGYVLRVWAGGVGTDISLSAWIVLMTFLLTLFLALAKRRDDVAIYEATGERMRHHIDLYSSRAIDKVLRAIAGMIFGCYLLYAVSDEVMMRFGTHYVFVTSVFVLLGLLRYLHVTIELHGSYSPTRVLLRDWPLQVCILLWVLSFAVIIYW